MLVEDHRSGAGISVCREKPGPLRMTDQQLAILLLPLVLAVPPAVGFLLGMRCAGSRAGAMTALLVSIIAGLCCGAVWSAAVDLRAASMPGGNPWLGHVRGVTVTGLLLGGVIGAATSTFSGCLAGYLVWCRLKRRP